MTEFGTTTTITYTPDPGERFIYCYYRERSDDPQENLGDNGGLKSQQFLGDSRYKVCCIPLPECDVDCYTACCDSEEFIDGFIDSLNTSVLCSTVVPVVCPDIPISIYQCRFENQCVYNVVNADPSISQVFGEIYSCEGRLLRSYALPGDGSFDPNSLLGCELIWENRNRNEQCDDLCEDMTALNCVDFDGFNINSNISDQPGWSSIAGVESCRVQTSSSNRYLSIVRNNGADCSAIYAVPNSNADII